MLAEYRTTQLSRNGDVLLTELIITQPDDWHLHLRDGEVLKAVLPHTSNTYKRAIVMPNLVPPVVTHADALAYRQRIVSACPDAHDFEPLMTLYLTETTDPDDLADAVNAGVVTAVKLYPAGATTNSESGVRDIENVLPVLERMQSLSLPLLIHGEVTAADVDVFDREARFIETVLQPLRARLPELRIVLEHITTAEGVDFVSADTSTRTAATITPHHLVWNRTHIFEGGIRPHRYCLPIAKRERHRLALRAAAVSGDPRFFLGTDSAPHLDGAKEQACGCAGVFNAPTTLACLAQVFEQEDALDQLEGFTSLHGPAFYRLAPNTTKMRLVREGAPVTFPSTIDVAGAPMTVFDPGFPMHWRAEVLSS